jgi:succinate-semialdehyde dehydrogenase / glutarate-semialdehyde dehydrogenase
MERAGVKIRNPRTGQYDYAIAPLDGAGLDNVCARLRSAQPGWAARTAEERGALLLKLANALAAHAAPIADALTIDTGRRAISVMEMATIPPLLRRWAGTAPTLIREHSVAGRDSASAGVAIDTDLVPYPLVGAISPWNFPLTLALIDAVPALAAGCAVIVKPSEVTPRFIRPLMAAITSVPEVAAVLALVEGDGATGAALVERVDYVAFTGSVATGRKVAEGAARAFIPASLELGGKDPMIVLASAHVPTAARTALRASIVNSGQACQSIERVYVDRAIAAPFLEALVTEAAAVRLNYPDMTKGDIGPFIFARQAEIVEAQIKDALAKGARLLCGGKVAELGGGLYLLPTVLADVTPDMAVMAEENFGPVIPVTIFDTVDQAVALANDGVFGLSGAVFAATDSEAAAVARRLNCGAVSVNDGSLTSMVWDAEKSSFGLSGMGPSRMGDSGLLRFFRKRSLLRQLGNPLPLAVYSEEGVAT